jgi:sec-independent protein translocase protein TatB
MNLGLPEMIFIFLLALIIFGPKKLPEIGRQIGRALNEFKRASNEFKAQIENEISSLDLQNAQAEIEKAKQKIMAPLESPTGTVASGVVEHEVPPAPEVLSPEVNSVAKAPDA